MRSPESSFGASDARGQRYLSLKLFKGIVQFTLTNAASRPAATIDADVDFVQSWDVSALAPTLGSFSRQGLLNNSPVAIARIIANYDANSRSLVARARARGAPVACALELTSFALAGGRLVNNRIFLCHDPATGTTHEAQVATIGGRGQRWLF